MAASSLLRSLTGRGCAGPTAFSRYYRHLQYPFSTAAAAGAQGEAGWGFPGLGPTAKGEKARVVVLGTGWAGSRLMKDLDTGGYDVVCVAPRNHMVFTPLLASTCVGTLEFRSVAEPLARIQPAVSKSPGSHFFLARCTGVDPDAHTIDCETVTDGQKDALEPWKFKVAYDKLVFACGAEASTFGIHGVADNAVFLREVHHAQEIRRRLLLNLMLSEVPGMPALLICIMHAVPSAESSRTVRGLGKGFSGRPYPRLCNAGRPRLEPGTCWLQAANEILSSFDVRLRQYAAKQLVKSGVRLVRGIVKDVQPNKLILDDGEEVPYGVLVWSTGVGASSFVKSLPFPKSPGGRIGVDEWLRVPSVQDVYAIGDCSGFLESTGKEVLPALAQVAERQGKYLAQLLNRVMKAGGGHATSAAEVDVGPPFVYKHLGSMATVGRYKALVDLRQSKVR
ncbi:hypothetical protein PR202_ga04517 [Eleusine coracana subsp. coracana]|uniref:FAD/NAD(P)-binding domain-containing protein n=1 Tax=Eleusine coracana subsp. coracana TaxID=191504 RepID=A0AAV5BQ41_ELECO|nr:hypothetical protein PR202_ga04517 [Eleusine coracana subsp. coracana]